MASTGKFQPGDGDWICTDATCGNVNFSRRTKCNKCGKDKESGTEFRKGGQEIGKNMAEKSKGLFSADDWQCKTCGNVNWMRRNTCNMCNSPKCGKIEHRTGFGGGYMEREQVEYVEKEVSDSEYDQYGRKKKKYSKPDTKTTVVPPPKPPSDDDDDDDDSDEDVDVSKYKLDSDEDDDDEDVDLSKYDLSDDSDGNAKNNARNNTKNSAKRSRSASSSSSAASGQGGGSRKRPHTQSRSRSSSSYKRDGRSRSRSSSSDSSSRSDHHRRYRRSRSRS